jgi:glycosyltransferase involved in cell wall biosynthesis
LENRIDITFILPTFNRKEFVCRAIDSCLSISKKSEKITVKVIVLDGYSTDGSWDILNEKYSDYNNIVLRQVSKNLGFQETAFLGVDMVETEYATFMYNDDILSDYYFEFIEKMLQSNQEFIVGYGTNYDVNNKYSFQKPKFIKEHSDNVILNYFGYFNFLEYSYLPVSPINTVSRTEVLREWVEEVRDFVKGSSFRDYLMVKQNVGPDLILFLFNLYRIKNEFLMCNSTISQLSLHDDSMSIGYGKIPLKTGYWLSRIWLFEKEIDDNSNVKKHLGKLAGYILLSGFNVAALNLRNGNLKHFFSSMYEIFKILICAIRKHFFIWTLISSVIVLYNMINRNMDKLTPR